MAARFLTLADVREILNISAPQAYALVKSGELPAIQIGGRNVWRVEASELEAYIARMYEQTRARTEGGGGTGGTLPEQRSSDPSEAADHL